MIVWDHTKINTMLGLVTFLALGNLGTWRTLQQERHE